MFGFGGKTRAKPRKAGRPKRPEISYRLTNENYSILSEEEKMEALRSWIKIFHSSSEKAFRVMILNRQTGIAIPGDVQHDYVDQEVYVTSKYDMGSDLTAAGFSATRLESPVVLKHEAEGMAHVRMPGGVLCRAYSVYDFSRSIKPAWITRLSGIASAVAFDVRYIKPEKARSMLLNHASTLSSRLGKRHQEEAMEAREVNDLLVSNETILYDVTITALMMAPDAEALASSCREFERAAARQQIKVMAVAGKQGQAVGGWGSRMMFPAQSCAALYPFSSGDIVESSGSGGVYLGTNELNGVPVIYDYILRTNYNMTILGSSGYGKSMTAKTYIDNFMRMLRSKYGPDQRHLAYIFDLHGEYAAIAGHLGMEVKDLMGTQQMGLDPFVLFDSADQAVGILAEVSHMPDNLRSLTFAHAKGAGSTRELVQRLRDDKSEDHDACREASTYLAQFTEGSKARLFEGNMTMPEKTVFTLRGAKETDEDSMLISLALQKVWQDMRAQPRHIPKFLVLEEAWFVLRMPSTARIISNIARSGRKENVHMILMTQDIDEVLNNEHGSAVIKNSATVVLMRLMDKSADMLKKVMGLSDSERQMISALERGQAIIRADSNRIKMRVRPTKEQLELFDTSAMGLESA